MLHSILQKLKDYGGETFQEPPVSVIRNNFAQDRDIKISMLRLDEVHKDISGNKLFKLIYFLEEALASNHKKLVTFGGAYSNHLAATAYACHILNINCIAIIRGEEPLELSDTLIFCQNHGMQLDFIPRQEYKKISSLDGNDTLIKKHGNHILVPEGGYSKKGMQGASLISNIYAGRDFSHICLAMGTATTLAGILGKSKKEIVIMGFPAIKGMHDVDERLRFLGVEAKGNLTIADQYHFGGFGKKTPELLAFMNQFYEENKIPLDIVYTSKMMYGVYDLLQKNYFPEGSDILCIHTGGLQGNSSVKDFLVY